MPTEHSSFAEKCYSSAPLVESILKQYNLYVEEGKIDPELVQMITGTEKFQNIKSLIQEKYAYTYGNEAANIMHMLFSDQSSIGYTKISKGKYSSFYEMVIREKLKLSDFAIYQEPYIKHLIDKGIVSESEEGYILFADVKTISVLYRIYMDGVVNVQHDPVFNDTFIKLKKQEYITIESSLLAKQEASYFNFYLNKSEFRNGYDLRNRYSHGVTQTCQDEDEHKVNYFMLLHLVILLAIKINDDLCLKAKEQEEL